MENPEKATAVLRQLAEAGAGLALDDFGTGYSSLSYLNQFTFDTIKIDRSFLQASGENGTGSVILRSVVALAHELGKKVVVEGVETEDDVGLLRTIGCEYGQGFYYDEPMTEREALQLVKVARRAERRMKRRGLLRKRERMVEDSPDEDVPQSAVADPPRTAARPQMPPATNGAAASAHTAPAVTAPKTTPRSMRASAPAEGTQPAGARPLGRLLRQPVAAPLQTLPPTPLRSESPASACSRDTIAAPSRRRRTARMDRRLPAAPIAPPAQPRTARRRYRPGPPRRLGAPVRLRCRGPSRVPSPGKCGPRRPTDGRRRISPICRPRSRRAWPSWRDALPEVPLPRRRRKSPTPTASRPRPEAGSLANPGSSSTGASGQAWPASLTRCEGIDADLGHGALVFLLEVAIEQQIEVGRTMQPAVGLRSRSRAGRPASRHSRAPGWPGRAPCRRRWP